MITADRRDDFPLSNNNAVATAASGGNNSERKEHGQQECRGSSTATAASRSKTSVTKRKANKRALPKEDGEDDRHDAEMAAAPPQDTPDTPDTPSTAIAIDATRADDRDEMKSSTVVCHDDETAGAARSRSSRSRRARSAVTDMNVVPNVCASTDGTHDCVAANSKKRNTTVSSKKKGKEKETTSCDPIATDEFTDNNNDGVASKPVTTSTSTATASTTFGHAAHSAHSAQSVNVTVSGGGGGGKAKFVYNAYNPHQAHSCTSDDENVILTLNVPPPYAPELNGDYDRTFGEAADQQFQPYDHSVHNSFLSKPSFFGDASSFANEDGGGNSHPRAPPEAMISAGEARDLSCSGCVPPRLDNRYARVTDGPVTGTTESMDPSQNKTKYRKVRLLVDFEEKNKANEWPSSTSIHCYWCCHKFDNPPCGIPLKYVNGKFYVTGCFCSLECAAAYNFNNGGSVDEIWDRYSLINMLSAKLNPEASGSMVAQAPDRLALTMFGGYMGIEEFRRFCPTHKLTVVNFPPMMTLTRQIEEISDNDVRSTHKYVPIDNERIDRYEKKLNLKRTKPLATVKNTLDRTMNIRYNPAT